jgi:hypothetical protein
MDFRLPSLPGDAPNWVATRQVSGVWMEDRRVLARILALAVGLPGGVLLAVASQIVLDHLKIELAAVWADDVAPAAQVGSALAWWLIAGAALGGGYATTTVARLLIRGAPMRPGIAWLFGAAVTALLAGAGHLAGGPSDFDPSAHVAASFAGMVGALIASSVGAALALRR